MLDSTQVVLSPTWKQSHVDQLVKDSGSVKPIWDSLRKNCLIVGGPYDCYQK
jgi:hypothetical protein